MSPQKTTAQPKMYGHHISHHYNITSVLHSTEKPFALFRPDLTTPVCRMHVTSFLKIIHFPLDFARITCYYIITEREYEPNHIEIKRK